MTVVMVMVVMMMPVMAEGKNYALKSFMHCKSDVEGDRKN